MHGMFSAWRGRIREAAARFLPAVREKPMASAMAGPRHASSGCRVGLQADDETGEAELPLAPQPFGDDDGLDLRDALFDLAVDDHVVVLRPVAGLLGRLRHSGGDDGG